MRSMTEMRKTCTNLADTHEVIVEILTRGDVVPNGILTGMCFLLMSDRRSFLSRGNGPRWAQARVPLPY